MKQVENPHSYDEWVNILQGTGRQHFEAKQWKEKHEIWTVL